MASNTHGHVRKSNIVGKYIYRLIFLLDNLSKARTETLKGYWIALANAICNQNEPSTNQIVDSVYGDELFDLIGTENPDVVLLRWLRACKWNINDAVQQLIDTLKWQQNWGVRAFIAKGEKDLSEEEIKTGKCYFIGYDKVGRPVTYVSVRNHIKDQFPLETSEKLAVFHLFTVRKLLQAPVESGMLVFDFAQFGIKNMDYNYATFFINLLQSYYPGAVNEVLVINTPWVFYACWAIIQQWLSPSVKSKIHFISDETDLAKHIDPSMLPQQLDGSHSNFKYIPPTVEDEAMETAFRADVQGKAEARAVHNEAAQNYLSVTLRWTQNEECLNLLADRAIATTQLRDAFERLMPYISTRTHYHRSGAINDSIFQVTYNRLRTQCEQ